jgi:hypothetical protein
MPSSFYSIDRRSALDASYYCRVCIVDMYLRLSVRCADILFRVLYLPVELAFLVMFGSRLVRSRVLLVDRVMQFFPNIFLMYAFRFF